MKRQKRVGSHSDLNETGIFVFLTMVIFFVAVGFPTLINTSPTLGYEGVEWTPVTTYYQQAYAEQEVMQTLAYFNYNPIVLSAFLVMPTAIDNPPPDPAQYFELKYSQGIELEFGFSEFVEYVEQSAPKITSGNGDELFKPKNLLNINNFQILPKAYAGAPPPPIDLLVSDTVTVNQEITTIFTPSVSAVCESDIGQDFRVGCYPFDFISPTIYTNLGSLGSSANAEYFESNVASLFNRNSSGIIGQAVIQEGASSGDDQGEIRFGTDANKDQWNFFHAGNVGSNLTSVNFWINGDVDGAPEYPLFGTKIAGQSAGLRIFTSGATTCAKLDESATPSVSIISGCPAGLPADDGQWHMISYFHDKGNVSKIDGFANLCVDAVCGIFSGGLFVNNFTGVVIDPTNTLTIGNNESGVVENTFNVDETIVWEGYQLTQSDLDTMWNSGAGASGSGIGSSFQVLEHSFNDTDHNAPPNIATNEGTLGANADALYFENDIQEIFNINTTGKIVEAVIQEGTSSGDDQGEIRFGSEANRGQWDFIHRANVGSNLTSINFWLLGDVVGAPEYPILGTMIGTGSESGFGFWTRDFGTPQLCLAMYQDGVFVTSPFFDTTLACFTTGAPPDDGDWHMITLLMDKGNSTSFATACLDGSTNCSSINVGSNFTTSDSIADKAMVYGGSAEDSETGSVTENTFHVDDMAIWNGYILSDADIDALFDQNATSGIGETFNELELDVAIAVDSVSSFKTFAHQRLVPNFEQTNDFLGNAMAGENEVNIVPHLSGGGSGTVTGDFGLVQKTILIGIQEVRVKIGGVENLTSGTISGTGNLNGATSQNHYRAVDLVSNQTLRFLFEDYNPDVFGTSRVGLQFTGINTDGILNITTRDTSTSLPNEIGTGGLCRVGSSLCTSVIGAEHDKFNVKVFIATPFTDEGNVEFFTTTYADCKSNINSQTPFGFECLEKTVYDTTHENTQLTGSGTGGGDACSANSIERHCGASFYGDYSGVSPTTPQYILELIDFQQAFVPTFVQIQNFDCGNNAQGQLRAIIVERAGVGEGGGGAISDGVIPYASEVFDLSQECSGTSSTSDIIDIVFDMTTFGAGFEPPEHTILGQHFVGIEIKNVTDPIAFEAWDVNAGGLADLEHSVGELWSLNANVSSVFQRANTAPIVDSRGDSFSDMLFGIWANFTITNSYPEPDYYYTFDEDSCADSQCANYGKAGNLGKAIHVFGGGGASAQILHEPDGRVGEAIILNGSDTSSSLTELHLGLGADKGQWDSLYSFDEFDVTSINFWLKGDLSLDNETNHWKPIMTLDTVSSDADNANLWNLLIDNQAGGGDEPSFGSTLIQDSSVVFETGTSANPVFPPDGDWHMFTYIHNATQDLLLLCVDGVCTEKSSVAGFDFTKQAESPQEIVIGNKEVGTFGEGCSDWIGANEVCTVPTLVIDELSVWKGHFLTGSEIAFLFNNTQGTQVQEIDGETYPDPAVYHTFDDVNCQGDQCTNYGTFGGNATAYNVLDDGTTKASYVHVNGTLGDAVSIVSTEVNLGLFDNRNQWGFLADDFNNTKRFVSFNYWIKGSTTGNSTEIVPTFMIDHAGSPIGEAFFAIGGGTDGDGNISYRVTSAGDATFIGQIHADWESDLGAGGSLVNIPDDGEFHMVTVLLDKEGAVGTGTTQLCIDAVCGGEFGFRDDHNASVTNNVTKNLVIGESDCLDTTNFGIGGAQCLDKTIIMDDLAIWDDHYLNPFEIKYLFNNGTGNEVLGRVFEDPEVYYTFDFDDCSANICQNFGTLGSTAIANHTSVNATSVHPFVFNTTNGLPNLGDSIIIDGGDSPSADRQVILGNDTIAEQFNFLINRNTNAGGSNVSTYNMWIRMNSTLAPEVDDLVSLILSAFDTDEDSVNAYGMGMLIHPTQGSVTTSYLVSGSGSGSFNHLAGFNIIEPSLQLVIPEDNDWHMLTVILDKRALDGDDPLNQIGTTYNGMITHCIDTVCAGQTNQNGWSGSETGNLTQALTIGSNQFSGSSTCDPNYDLGGVGCFTNTIEIADMGMWKNLEISAEQINYLFNEGAGQALMVDPVIMPSASALPPLAPVVFNVTITDTVSANDDKFTEGLASSKLKIYLPFDADTCTANICDNEGTLGATADGNHTTDDGATTEPIRHSLTGVLDEGIVVNGTDSGATMTELKLGNFADRSQFDFLWDDNDANITSVNFWLNGDIDGAPIVYTVVSMGAESSTSNHIWIGGNGVGGRLNMDIRESIDATPRIIGSGADLNVPDDGNFHMLTIVLDKQKSTGTVTFCVDGVCQQKDRTSAWDNAHTGTSLTELKLGEIDCNDNGFGAGCNNTELEFDDFAIWDGYALTSNDITELYNNGTGKVANEILGSSIEFTVAPPPPPPVDTTGEEVIYNGLRADKEILLLNILDNSFNGFVFSNMTADNHTITKIRVKIPSTIDATTGNLTGIVMTDCADGTQLQNCTIQGTSDVWDIADHQGSLGTYTQQFNFTGMPELSGEIAVGFKVFFNDEFQLFFNNKTEYPFPTTNETCLRIDGINPTASVNECFNDVAGAETLAIKVFATKQGNADTLLFDTMSENQLEAFSGFSGGDTCSQGGTLTGNGAKCGATALFESSLGSTNYFGQLVDLVEDKVTKVQLNALDCGQLGGHDNGNFTALVMDKPTEGTSTVPTIQQTSNIIFFSDICVDLSQTDLDNINDVEFNFASPVELTGEFLIAIKLMGAHNELGLQAWDSNQTSPFPDLRYHDGVLWVLNADTSVNWIDASTGGGIVDSRGDIFTDMLMAVFVEAEQPILTGNVVVYNSMTEQAIFNNEPFVPLVAEVVGVGSSVTIGETVVFDGEDLTSVRLKISGAFSHLSDGNITAVLWDDDATIGVDETQDFTELARSSTVDMATEFVANGLIPTLGDPDKAGFVWQFNFTEAGTLNLNGTFLIGFEVRGIDGSDEFAVNIVNDGDLDYPFVFQDGRCWESGSSRQEPIDDTVNFCDVSINSLYSNLQIKVFGNKDNITDEVIFDNSHEVLFETIISGTKGGNNFIDEGSRHGGSGFFNQGKNGTDVSTWDVVGNVMPLTNDTITKVVMPLFDCGGVDGEFQLQSVIYDVPTEGVSTTPTIQSVSDIFTIPSCVRIFPTGVFTDIQFNFTNAPELTGDYFIGFRENGTGASSPKFYPAWDINASQSRPLEFCVGCVTPAVEDVEAWTRHGTGNANWTSAQGDGVTDDSGDSFSVFSMIVFAEPTELAPPPVQVFNVTITDTVTILDQVATNLTSIINLTITDTVTATDGGAQDGANIALANLVVYHRFDTQDKFNNGLSTLNLGTLGSNADAQYFIPDTNLTATAIVTNTTGLINESIFQDGDVDGVDRAEVRMGVFADRSQYDFLHRANTLDNLTSINFWINGDTDGGADYPILDTIELNEPIDSGGDGMVIFTANGQLFFDLYHNDNPIIQEAHSSQPPDDGQWHMITMIYDKGNMTGALADFGILCIDGSTGCETLSATVNIAGTSNTANNTLTLGSRHDPFGNIVENKFNIDDLAVWNGHQLTLAQIDELFNGGAGKPVIGDNLVTLNVTATSVQSACDSSIGQEFRVACYTFDIADCSGNICSNSGTFGSTADANHTTSNRATTVTNFFNSSAIINEAIRVNGTDFGTPLTEVHLGDFADRSQWDFLWDDNEANVTSMNYWLMQDIDGGGGAPFYGTLGMGLEEFGSGSFVWIGGRGVGGDMNLLVTENSLAKFSSTENGALGVPDDNEFHMVTIIIDKQNTTNTAKICVDGSSNCVTFNRSGVWDNGFTGTSVQDLTIGEIDCANIGASGCNNTYLQMDDLAIWKEYQLTDEDIDNLFSQTLPPATVQSICNSNIGEEFRVACYTFDIADCSGNICSNSGTFGSTADANHTTSNRATTVSHFFNSSAIINEAIRVNGTDFGTPLTEVHLGDFADRSQWDFLHDDNEANVTSINYWLMQDIDGGGGDPFYGTMGMGQEELGSGSYIWIGGRSVGGDINMIVEENSINRIFTVNNALGVPDDNEFHMVTIIMDKQNVTSTVKYCVDGSSNCTTINRASAWSNAISQTSVQDLTIGEIDCANIGASGCNNTYLQMDDLAIWKGYQLTDEDIDTIFNMSLTEQAGQLFNIIINDTVKAFDTDGDGNPTNIALSNLVLYHRFDTVDINNDTSTNLGTIGTDADGDYFENGSTSPFNINTTGLIGQSITQEGTSSLDDQGEVIFDLVDPDTFDFLYTGNVGSNLTSVNFWINGDVVGSPDYPLLDNIDDFSSPSTTGWGIQTREGTDLLVYTLENNILIDQSTAVGTVPPDDGQWHMVTVLMNKGNTTGNWIQICLNTSCTNAGAMSNDFTGNTGNPPINNFTLGSTHSSVLTENTFNVDDLAIWNGHQLTQQNIDDLYDGGAGRAVTENPLVNVTLIPANILNQTITDTVTTSDQVIIKKFTLGGSACDTGIGSEFLVGCYTFDTDDFVGIGSNYTNLGTLGSAGNANYFEDGVLANFVSNSSGIINQAVIQNGTSSGGGATQGEIRIGTDPSSFDFLTIGNSGSNLTSINFWLLGDVVGSIQYPLISSGSNTDANSFLLYTESGDIRLMIREAGSGIMIGDVFNGIIPPDDGQWHMITVLLNKTDLIGYARVCVDGAGNCDIEDATVLHTGTGSSPPDVLTIGDEAHNNSGSIVENTFNVDDLTIWNGHLLTDSQINATYNNGIGVTARTIEQGSQVLHHSFDDVDLVVSADVAQNLGTFGTTADAIYLENNVTTAFNQNLTGIIEQAVIQEGQQSGDDQGTIQLGLNTTAGRSQWDFLHRANVGSNLTSINFWINGDAVGDPDYPLFDNLPQDTPSAGCDTAPACQNYFFLNTQSNLIAITIDPDDAGAGEIVNNAVSTLTIPDDGQWHMVTFLMDKGNTTILGKICVDGSTNCDGTSFTMSNQWSASASSSGSNPLRHGSNVTIPSSTVENTWNVDDIAIWNGYQLTNEDIDNLFNVTAPAPAVTITDTVTVNDAVNATLIPAPFEFVPFNRHSTDDGVNLFTALGANWGLGQEVNFTDIKPTKVRISDFISDSTNGTVSIKIYSNVSANIGVDQSGLVLEEQSDSYNMTTQGSLFDTNTNQNILQFNFTNASTLDGTDFAVVISGEGFNAFTELPFATTDLVDGRCLEFSTGSLELGGTATSCTDHQFKLFAETATQPSIVYDTTLESQDGIALDFNFIGNGTVILGNRVNLTNSQISQVKVGYGTDDNTPEFDGDFFCTGANGTAVAKVWNKPTAGNLTVPTVQATSDSFTPTCLDIPQNILFNFTDASPVLTGEFFIGIEFNGFNNGGGDGNVNFAVHRSEAGGLNYPPKPYDPIVFMAHNVTGGWIETPVSFIESLNLGVIQNGTLTSVNVFNQTITDITTVNDDVTFNLDKASSLADSTTVNDDLTFELDKSLADSTTVNDDLTFELDKSLADSTTVNDDLTFELDKTLADTVTVNDAVNATNIPTVLFNQTITDTVIVSDEETVFALDRTDDDTWEVKEHTNGASGNTQWQALPAEDIAIFSEENNALGIESGGFPAVHQGGMYLFKSFNADFIQGKNVTIDWHGIKTVAGGGGQSMRIDGIWDCSLDGKRLTTNFRLWGDFADGQLRPSCVSEPPVSADGRLTSGNGITVTVSDTGRIKTEASINDDLITITNATSGTLTLTFVFFDFSPTRNSNYVVYAINITDSVTDANVAFWNFTDSKILFEDDRTHLMLGLQTNNTSEGGDFGLVNSTFTGSLLPQNILTQNITDIVTVIDAVNATLIPANILNQTITDVVTVIDAGVNATIIGIVVFNQTLSDLVTVIDQEQFNITKLFSDITNATDQEQFVITKLFSDTTTILDAEIILKNPVPNAIIDLDAFAVGNSCELTWSTPVNLGLPLAPINGYGIFSSVDGGLFIPIIANTSNTDTAFNHTGLNAFSTYLYNVTSFSIYGTSLSSNIASCVPQAGSDPPSIPTGLTAINDGQNVFLDWDHDGIGNPTGYKIERALGDGAFFDLVSNTGDTSTNFLDTTVDPATKYRYRVSAINAFGTSDPSQIATITTLFPPSQPTLTAEQVGDIITLTWTEPNSDEPINGYTIERRINFGSFSILVANTTTTSLTFDDLNVTKPNTFGYRVHALSILGDGKDSNIVDVVFGSHTTVIVLEQDGSGFKGGGIVRLQNTTLTLEQALDSGSTTVFHNLDSANYNFTFIDDDNFILNKTFNFPHPTGNLSNSFTIFALVFDTDCPSAGTGTDVRIKVNYTDGKDITEYPATPVCDSSDKVSWSVRWQGDAGVDMSTMIADFISNNFKANADRFLVSAIQTDTIYNSGENQIESVEYVVNNNVTTTDVTINFDLFLGQAPSSGGSGGSGGGGSPPAGASIPELKVELLQRLTGLSVLSRTHPFASAGDVIEGSISVEWEGEAPLTIKSIDVGEFSDIIRFELPPILLAQSIEGSGDFAKSSAEIPYIITLPPFICDEMLGITQNCVNEELISMPVAFVFESEGVDYTASTSVMVDLRPIPFDLPQFQIILLGIVLIVSAIAGNFIRSRIRGKGRGKKLSKRARTKKFKKKFDSS